ncbi:MAG: primosomal protein N' [Tissierellia bacterium]|nr:primosomal protein N' [Tissierellia bacterium]
MYYRIILLDAVSDYDRPYIYKSNKTLQKGQLVLVPFGRGNVPREGLVLGEEEAFSGAKSILKETGVILSASSLEALNFLSHYYAIPPAAYSRLFLPKALRVEARAHFVMRENLSNEQIREYLSIKDNEEKLRQSGLCNIQYQYNQRVKLPQNEMLLSQYSLLELEEYLNKLPKSYKRQREIIEELIHNYPQMIPRGEQSLSSIKTLEDKGIVLRVYISRRISSSYRQIKGFFQSLPLLESAEKKALEQMSKEEGGLFLLHREKSSAWNIYLHLAENSLEKEKRFILLFPDASLLPAAVELFKEHFGDLVGVYHGKMSPKEQKSELLSFIEGRFPIMITSRMGLFLPLEEVDTIIVDECQDDGYVSKHPYFHGNELASFYGQQQGIKTIFASAVPPLELYLREDIYKVNLVEESLQRPKIELVDMRRELSQGNRSPLSERMIEEITQVLENKGLGFLLMNRKNYASYVFCRKCGHALYCPQCRGSLHYDQKTKTLFCPGCGYKSPAMDQCPQCGSNAFRFYGGGIQMVREELQRLFPQARIVNVDAKTMEEKDGYIKLHRLLKEKKMDLLLGTSLIAKGFDYDVSFLGVINADFYLHIPSYRAAEKGFQLLKLFLERGNRQCTALIQTYEPKNYVLQGVLQGDVENFLKKEMALRQARKLPPFSSYILIHLKGDVKTIDKISKEMILELQGHGANISESFGQWIPGERKILITADDPSEIKEHLLSLHASRPWQFSVEVDPIESV